MAARLHAKAEAMLADGLPAPCQGCVDVDVDVDVDVPDRRRRILHAIETAAMRETGGGSCVDAAALGPAQSPVGPDVQ